MTYIMQQYIAERDGETITGSGKEIDAALQLSSGYAAKLAASGKRTKTGWTVRVVEGSQQECRISTSGRYWAKIYYKATKSGEDAIIGSINEIALLTGLNDKGIRKTLKNGDNIYHGWKIVEATREEIETAEAQWA